MVLTIDVRVREEAIARYLVAESVALMARRFGVAGSDASVDAWAFAEEMALKYGLPSTHTVYSQVNTLLRDRWPLKMTRGPRAFLGRDPRGNSHLPSSARARAERRAA